MKSDGENRLIIAKFHISLEKLNHVSEVKHLKTHPFHNSEMKPGIFSFESQMKFVETSFHRLLLLSYKNCSFPFSIF